MSETQKRYLIYPPEVKFSLKWQELPQLLPFPERYGLETAFGSSELKNCIELGYSVSADDQDFVNGPFGGGIIVVKRDIRRWFPNVLFAKDCDFKKPPGFGRVNDYGFHILVPRFLAKYRLGLEELPSAPSPYFSVEPTSGNASRCWIAVGFERTRNHSDAGLFGDWIELGLLAEKFSGIPQSMRKEFESIKNPDFEYAWYAMNSNGIELKLKLAAFVYLGLCLNARLDGAARVVHLFSSEFISGLPFPSALLWRGGTRKVVNVGDW